METLWAHQLTSPPKEPVEYQMASQMFNYAHSDHSTSAYSGEHGEVFEGSAIGSNFDNTFDNKIYGVDTTDMINDDGLAYQLDQFTMDSQFSHMMPVMPEMDLLPTPSALLDSYGDDSYGYGESNVLGQVFGGDLIGDIAAFVTPLHAEPWTGTRADWMTSNHSLSVPSQAKFGLLETTYPGSLDGYNPDSGYDSFQTADTASQFSAPPGFMIPQDDDEREQNCDIEQDLTPRQDHVAVQDDASEQSHTSENGHGSEQEHSDTVERPNKRAKKSSRKSSHKVSHKGFHCLEPGPHRTRDFANIHDLERHRRSTHGIRSTTSPCLYFRCMVEGCPSGDKEWDRKDNFRSHLKRRHFNDMPDEESTMEANAFLAHQLPQFARPISLPRYAVRAAYRQRASPSADEIPGSCELDASTPAVFSKSLRAFQFPPPVSSIRLLACAAMVVWFGAFAAVSYAAATDVRVWSECDRVHVACAARWNEWRTNGGSVERGRRRGSGRGQMVGDRRAG
ncbi:hypothetical protein ANO11243_089710 [Dothideomycetidae sp. 11243]|nr:hypothetical protein ANO11243_089710 [fungal sp. No.11243]